MLKTRLMICLAILTVSLPNPVVMSVLVIASKTQKYN